MKRVDAARGRATRGLGVDEGEMGTRWDKLTVLTDEQIVNGVTLTRRV